MDVLKIWDETTQQWTAVPAIQGPKGDPGEGATQINHVIGTDNPNWLGVDSAVDLDTFLTSGVYWIKTATHMPWPSTWFCLVVAAHIQGSSTDADFQTVYIRGGYTATRSRISNAWSSWHSPDYYLPSEKLYLNNTLLPSSIMSGSNNAFSVDLVLSKQLPSWITITHNLTMNWFRGEGATYSGSISSVTRASFNALRITFSLPNGGPGALKSITAMTNTGDITFGGSASSGGSST